MAGIGPAFRGVPSSENTPANTGEKEERLEKGGGKKERGRKGKEEREEEGREGRKERGRREEK